MATATRSRRTAPGVGETGGVEVTARRPGRPRDEGAAQAILTATMELMAEVGFGAVTVDAVAQRAGVGKATIYRRWESKERLVLDAISASTEPAPVPDTGSVAGDLKEIYGRMADSLSQPESRSLLMAMVAQATVDEVVHELLGRLVSQRKEVSRAVLRRAIDAGDLPADADVDLLVDLLAGAVLYRTCIAGRPVGPKTLDRIVTTILRGAAAS
jgi:AcrR family transcriptional regulator